MFHGTLPDEAPESQADGSEWVWAPSVESEQSLESRSIIPMSVSRMTWGDHEDDSNRPPETDFEWDYTTLPMRPIDAQNRKPSATAQEVLRSGSFTFNTDSKDSKDYRTSASRNESLYAPKRGKGMGRSKTPELRPDENSSNVLCPFAIRTDADVSLNSLCQSELFRDIAKLNEHLRRVHLLGYTCLACWHSFQIVSEGSLEVLKKEHEKRCPHKGAEGPSSKQLENGQIQMTPEQFERWTHWREIPVHVIEGEHQASRSWRKIYEAIYPSTEKRPASKAVHRKGSPALLHEMTRPSVDLSSVGLSGSGQLSAVGPSQTLHSVSKAPIYSGSDNSSPSGGSDTSDLASTLERCILAQKRAPRSLWLSVEKRATAIVWAQMLVPQMMRDICPQFCITSSKTDELLLHLGSEVALFLRTYLSSCRNKIYPLNIFQSLGQEIARRCDGLFQEEYMDKRTTGDGSHHDEVHFHEPRSDFMSGGGNIEPLDAHEAFDYLTRQYRSLVERYYCNLMAVISHRISIAVAPSDQVSVSFNLDLDLLGFFRRNYEQGLRQGISSTLCFVGGLANAYSTTIGSYFEAVWPNFPHYLLDSIRHYLVHLETREGNDLPAASGQNNISIDNFGHTFRVDGSSEFVTSIGQQLAWLAAACQISENGRIYSRVDIALSQPPGHSSPVSSDPTFSIRVATETPPVEELDCCWKPLLGDSVLVTSFPTPRRPANVIGLESRVEILAGLIGIQQAVTYRGGYVLKGRFHALVPIERFNDAVQWHLVSTSPVRLVWDDIEKHCPKRVLGMLPEDCDHLLSSRAVLGWCEKVENMLGTDGFPYEQIKHSQTKLASQASPQLTELTIGVSHFLRATAKVTFARKDGISPRERSDDYLTILNDASELPIFMYDTKNKRTIYTSGERLILQIILHAHRQTPFIVDGQQVTLDPLTTQGDLREVMKARAEIPLMKGPVLDQTVPQRIDRFKHQVQKLYERLDGMQESMHSVAHHKRGLSLPTKASRSICGWEYLELVLNYRQIAARRRDLRESCGSWPAFAMDRDIRGIFLLGHDFGDLLRPLGTVCPLYTSVPQGLDLLGIAVRDLETLFKQRESWCDPEQLTSSGWHWHRPGLLFESCVRRNGTICQCRRVQEFLAPGAKVGRWFDTTQPTPLGRLEPMGGLIFGEPKRSLDKIHREYDVKTYSPAICVAAINSAQLVSGQLPSEPLSSPKSSSLDETDSATGHTVSDARFICPSAPSIPEATSIDELAAHASLVTPSASDLLSKMDHSSMESGYRLQVESALEDELTSSGTPSSVPSEGASYKYSDQQASQSDYAKESCLDEPQKSSADPRLGLKHKKGHETLRDSEAESDWF